MADFNDKHSIEDVVALRASNGTLLVKIRGQEVWVPQVQIDDDSLVFRPGHEGTLVVSGWLADRRGWR